MQGLSTFKRYQLEDLIVAIFILLIGILLTRYFSDNSKAKIGLLSNIFETLTQLEQDLLEKK